MPQAEILIVDDEPDIRRLVGEILADEGYRVRTAENAAAARAAREQARPDLVLLDVWMPDLDGVSLLKEWYQAGLTHPVVMMSGHGTVETAVEATRLGAYDFIEKPIGLAKLLLTVERALESQRLKRENEGLRKLAVPLVEHLGAAPATVRLRGQLERLATLDTAVLLRGEVGSGKEALARYLHSLSPRAARPFVVLSAGGIALENASSELYGVEVGHDVRPGRLEQADGGTLYLDEPADLPLSMQQSLAAALERRSVRRAGGAQELALDVRLVTGTAHDLEALVQRSALREDLYYQLNVLPIDVPALRDRLEDVPDLLRVYSEYFPARDRVPLRTFTLAAQNRLRRHDWPGNIRELRNLVQRLLILGGGGPIDVDEVEAALSSRRGTPAVPAMSNEPSALYALPWRDAREAFEREYLSQALRAADGSVGKLARAVGLERTHLYRKLKALGLDFGQDSE